MKALKPDSIFRYSVGDTNVPFCLQSVSKPLTYAMALDDLSPNVVHEYVGHEPSGVAFNTISLDYRGKLFVAMGTERLKSSLSIS